MKTKVRKIGNSLGVILPKEVIQTLTLEEGDTLTLEEDRGSIRLSRLETDFSDWAEAYRQLNRDYSDVLSELAK